MRLKRFSFAILSEPKVRGIPARKTESEITVFSFTRDSVVLIAAKDGEATPMYKYDYRAIVFGESASQKGYKLGLWGKMQTYRSLQNDLYATSYG